MAAGQFWRLDDERRWSRAASSASDEPAGAVDGRAGDRVGGGSGRFVVLYFAAGLGGSTLFFCSVPPTGPRSGRLRGGRPAGGERDRQAQDDEDVRGDIGLFVLLVLYSVLVGFASFGWLTLIGGIAVGALAGAVLAYAPRRNRSAIQVGRPARRGRVCVRGGGRCRRSWPPEPLAGSGDRGHRGARAPASGAAGAGPRTDDQADQQQHGEPRTSATSTRVEIARAACGEVGGQRLVTGPDVRVDGRLESVRSAPGQSPPREKAASRSWAE